MSALPARTATAEPADLPRLQLEESREFRAYHEFLRAARQYMDGELVVAMHAKYQQAAANAPKPPTDAAAATRLLDDLPQFQLYSWYFRHLQRFKYHRASLGIFAALDSQRQRLQSGLEAAVGLAGERLRLDPDLAIPDYFRFVPFHQHTGGVTHDALDGLAYELGRRTTVAQHADANNIYRLLFRMFPQREYARVLDWGTGHGAALIDWQRLHPQSECHGVDLSAPCLKLAHRRALENGMSLRFSQQDLEHLDYPDEHFDLVFFNFMLHELPPRSLPALLAEARRVLKPGGLFAGHEFHLRPGDAFQNALQHAHGWLNNETYAVPWYDVPIAELARAAGFSGVRIEPFEALIDSVIRPERRRASSSFWYYYEFTR
ncbi:MAG: class I SAM-dependent methyltransferase [Steroidobacteraceae bacterium]